jgi:hypothetical protein
VKKTVFRNRSAVVLENEYLRVTVMEYGGHIAEIVRPFSQVNPMWQPAWISIDPTEWNASCEPIYGSAYEGKMLSCVLGHFLCLDTFGIPSLEERAAGAVLHGEALLTKCAIDGNERDLTCSWELPNGVLKLTRKLELAEGSFVLKITETLENSSARDYPTAWTQHVTLGPPFLEQGVTQFTIPDVRSMSLEGLLVLAKRLADSSRIFLILRASTVISWVIRRRASCCMDTSGCVRTFRGLEFGKKFVAGSMHPGMEKR